MIKPNKNRMEGGINNEKENYAAPDVELIEIKPGDVISVSVGSDNEIDYGDVSGGFS